MPPAIIAEESTCFGTTSNGRLENGCRLPYSGQNFKAYSRIGPVLGRTYVHCKVSEIILASYKSLSRKHPETVFVYGETGWASGGRFKPHKTHQNGLSVDFMVPVKNKSGKSVPLPTHALNKYGYGIDFNANGFCKELGLSIDFDAVNAHILSLKQVADSHKVRIWRVIFAPDLQPHLQKAKGWALIKGKVSFSKKRSWVRHDDHYHVDFDIPCNPMAK
ncbi:MAG: penicillin-insensitive murein endopeptidase [Desulfobacter sp.]|nr:MAG: penicillin-insensitive murein endopeptidase [Desulfobacter sp.]